MAATVRVWDPLVRVFHWTLVTSFLVAWISADSLDELHEAAGYVATALIAIRVGWGFVGTPHARFSQFVRSPRTVAVYLKDIATGRARRYVGHNPAGGAMVVALLTCLLGLCLTGWMYTTDTFWGVESVELAHEVLANSMLVLIGLHIAGVLLASRSHAENLIAAMFSGRKRAAMADDIE